MTSDTVSGIVDGFPSSSMQGLEARTQGTTMIRQTLLAASLLVAAASAASAGMEAYPGITTYDYWRGEACGDGGVPGSKCEQAFRRLCGRTPNAACVSRHRKTFSRSSSFHR